MRRRTLLRAGLGIGGTVAFGAAAGVRGCAEAATAPARVAAGEVTVRSWRWVALPDGAGLQVYLMSAVAGAPSSCPVTWTASGVVTAAWPVPLTVTAPAAPGPDTVTTSGGGYGFCVRRAA